MARKRRYLLTLNNPTEDDEIKLANLVMANPKWIKRMIACFEIGESGTPHYHVFIHCVNGTTGNAIKKRIFGHDRANWKVCKGTDYENYKYCEKGNLITKSEYESDAWFHKNYGVDVHIIARIGEDPTEDGEPDIWERIILMIHNGHSNAEIVRQYPSTAMRCQSALDRYRLAYEMEHQEWRDVEVNYISGSTGCGKSKYVMDKYGYNNVYRCTNKKHPFDQYDGEPVIVFEEFRSSFKIEDMLNWLDGYPLRLPARYADRFAHFTKVYILSNWEYYEQYQGVQDQHPETYAAWDRRIKNKLDMNKPEDLKLLLSTQEEKGQPLPLGRYQKMIDRCLNQSS